MAEGATGGGGDSDDSDEEDPPHTVSHSEACQALETLLKYAEQQEDIFHHHNDSLTFTPEPGI